MRIFILSLMGLAASTAFADPPEVAAARVTQSGDAWRFDVTISHPGETGWDDYADGWRVELADGSELGTRELLHPHVNEMPFTRSLGSVVIPAGTQSVYIRARTNVEGWNDTTLEVPLP